MMHGWLVEVWADYRDHDRDISDTRLVSTAGPWEDRADAEAYADGLPGAQVVEV